MQSTVKYVSPSAAPENRHSHVYISAITSFMNNARHIYCLFPIHTTSSILFALPQWQSWNLSSCEPNKGCRMTVLETALSGPEMTSD